MKIFESTIAMSVERFDAVSVIYWLIQRGSFARLSARANRCGRAGWWSAQFRPVSQSSQNQNQRIKNRVGLNGRKDGE